MGWSSYSNGVEAQAIWRADLLWTRPLLNVPEVHRVHLVLHWPSSCNTLRLFYNRAPGLRGVG